MKITYSVAMSADGFLARENGDVSWLDEVDIDENQTGLVEFFASVDGLIMGRHTYDFVFNYGSWPYEDKPTWICTHRELLPLQGANLFVTDAISNVLAEAESRGLEHLWLVGGGELASSFLEKRLLTHLSICEIPIHLGQGIPLFAKHKLEEIPAKTRTVIPKKGFRQIEIEVSQEASDE